MKNFLLYTALLLCTATGFAQYKLKKAERLFEEMAYTYAVAAYESYLEDGHTPAKNTQLRIADAYYYTNSYAKAGEWYGNIATAGALKEPQFNYYVQSLKATGQSALADRLLRDHLVKAGDRAALARFDRQKQYMDSLTGARSPYIVKNIAANTNKSDFGTAFYGGNVVYASAKDTTGPGSKHYKWNDQPFLDLYAGVRDSVTGELNDSQKFMPKSQVRYHNAAAVFTPDGQTVYYSTNTVKKQGRLNNADDGTNNIRLLKANVGEDELVNELVLPFNNIAYSNGHPALTPDGRYLIFTSDRPGGLGETDLYAVTISEDGTYGQPVNLGNVINTPGKEMFPFVSGDKLYFASTGHYGLGGLDIFESTISDGLRFSEPKNLGAPVNSNRDDFAYIVSGDDSYGYFSSNREGGKGDDDIYYFTNEEVVCKHLLVGTVKDAATKQPVAGITMTITLQNGEVLYELQTDLEGNYSAEVPCDTYVNVAAAKSGYSNDVKETTTPKVSGIVRLDFELARYEDLVVREDDVEKIKINPIYFDFDKYDITTQGAQELDKVVFVMEHFPEITIRIESHTDSRGNDAYNMELSQNRANATYDYLLSKGIDAGRIESVKGYGESRLLNRCSNGVKCTEEEHQLNRRSDFIVVN